MRNFIPKPKLPTFKAANFFGAIKDLVVMPFKTKLMRKLGTIALWTPKKILWALRKVCWG